MTIEPKRLSATELEKISQSFGPNVDIDRMLSHIAALEAELLVMESIRRAEEERATVFFGSARGEYVDALIERGRLAERVRQLEDQELWRAHAEPTLSALESLCAQLKELAQYIVDHVPRVTDHACAECVPGGAMLMPGFRCVPHRARALLAPSKPEGGG